MPDTPCAVKLCTKSTCDFRSSSLSGPFHTTSTFSSRAALIAPACTAFQNSCVVPLGTTAMRSCAGFAPASLAAVPSSVFFLQDTLKNAPAQNAQTQSVFPATALILCTKWRQQLDPELLSCR